MIRGDQSELIGLQGNMKKIGIDRGWEILRSTIYTDTCDLGSSSDDGLDNKGMIFLLFNGRSVWIYLVYRQRSQRFVRSGAWKVWIGLLMWLMIIVILEDNQIGERERRRSSYDGCGEETWDRKVMFKNQFVSDNAYRASL